MDRKGTVIPSSNTPLDIMGLSDGIPDPSARASRPALGLHTYSHRPGHCSPTKTGGPSRWFPGGDPAGHERSDRQRKKRLLKRYNPVVPGSGGVPKRAKACGTEHSTPPLHKEDVGTVPLPYYVDGGSSMLLRRHLTSLTTSKGAVGFNRVRPPDLRP